MSENCAALKKLSLLIVFLFIVTNPIALKGQEKRGVLFSFSLHTLKNGLQVILSDDESLPIVSIVVAYNVGSINEPKGKAGLAHLTENLMFLGSENVGPMQHIRMINMVGGTLNATTAEDKTVFFQTVPSNQLPRVLWLEADRMKFLQITEANVEQVKRGIIEEIRYRKSAEPYLESFWRFDEMLYPGFSYSHPVIGHETDLANLTAADVKNFYSLYYTPQNAVLAIAGNIDREKTLIDVRKYFETLPRGKDPPLAPEAEPLEKRTITEWLEHPDVPSPGFHLGYKLASPDSADFYPLKIIEYLLLKGATSRLHRRLVKKDRLVRHLSGGIEIRKDQARFKLFVLTNNIMMAQRSKRAIHSEINRLKSSFISEEELAKAKNMLRTDYVHQFQASLDRALFLAENFLSGKRLADLPGELDKYLQVTPTEIVGIINRYFTEEGICLDIIRK